MRSWHVFVSRQESKHSRFGLAIAIAVPCISTVRLSFASAKYGAKHVRVANLVFGLPTRGRAVVLAPCWIRPPISSAHAIRASALSSLRPATAPVRLSLHGRYGESFLQGYLRLLLAIANAAPCTCAVRFSFLSVRQGPKHVRAQSCVSGLPTISRAIVQVSGGTSPHSINAFPPSSLRACFFLGRDMCYGCGRSIVLVSGCIRPLIASLLGAGVDLLLSLRRDQAVAKRDAVIRNAGCASGMWASPGMTEPSLLRVMLQPPSPAPSPRAVYSMLRLPGGSPSEIWPHVEAAVDVKNSLSYWEASICKPSRLLTVSLLLGTVSHRNRSQALPISGLLSWRSRNCFDMFCLDHQRPKKASSRWST